jgi:hypothetical protein
MRQDLNPLETEENHKYIGVDDNLSFHGGIVCDTIPPVKPISFKSDFGPPNAQAKLRALTNFTK